MHFYRKTRKKKKDEKDFQVVTASYIGHRFRDEIEISDCEEAKQENLRTSKVSFL